MVDVGKTLFAVDQWMEPPWRGSLRIVVHYSTFVVFVEGKEDYKVHFLPEKPGFASAYEEGEGILDISEEGE